jgi:hypothetical protein
MSDTQASDLGARSRVRTWSDVKRWLHRDLVQRGAIRPGAALEPGPLLRDLSLSRSTFYLDKDEA